MRLVTRTPTGSRAIPLSRRLAWIVIVSMAWLAWSVPARADEVRLDFPDTVDLKVVVDTLAAHLSLNLIYDDTQLAKKVSLRMAGPIDKSDLPGLLRTILRSRGLALVAADQPGWLKIVPLDQLAGEAGAVVSELPTPGQEEAEIITFVLPIEHGDIERIKTSISSYLSKPGGSVLVAAETRALVLTDFARNVRRAVEIARLLDVAEPSAVIESIPVRHQDAAELAGLVLRFLAEREKAVSPVATAVSFSLQPDPLSGGLIAMGSLHEVAQARELIARFDQKVERRTDLFQPRYLSASRLRTLIEQLLPAAGLRMAIDEASNTLVVTARPEVQRQVADLLRRFDTQPPETARPMRFYKLMNRRADDVFETLGELLGGTPNDNSSAAAADGPTSRPVAFSPGSTAPGTATVETFEQVAAGDEVGAAQPGAPRVTAFHGKEFSLSLDEHTNSVIAIASPEIHQQIEQLIKRLDRRRPQVLIEVTFVSIAVDDSLTLGVELEQFDLGHPWDYLLFTSFGLSTIVPGTGERRLNVAPGGTGVLIAPQEVPFIIQTLATRGNTRIFSAPRILVDDNGTGRLESVAEAPFTSVNASTTVATTSFAGFAKAGTQVSIEPHIAEGNHLEIDYTLTVSSFTGAGTGTTPPPRSSDTISSTVRVPDAYTVIVGGLMTETVGESASQVPLLGDIPGLGWLFGVRNNTTSKVRLYAFIRPTVLRNEEFEDLKYISARSAAAAEISDGFPPDRPQYMK